MGRERQRASLLSEDWVGNGGEGAVQWGLVLGGCWGMGSEEGVLTRECQRWGWATVDDSVDTLRS